MKTANNLSIKKGKRWDGEKDVKGYWIVENVYGEDIGVSFYKKQSEAKAKLKSGKKIRLIIK